MKKERIDKEEIKEAEGTLKEMVKGLNELPTDTLQQLLDNLNDIEAYNKKHHLTTGSSTGAYAIAALEELLEHNECFLSICLLHEHIKTRMIDESKPLEAILLFEKEEDVEEWASDKSWVENVVNIISYSASKKDGYCVVSFLSDWKLQGKLILLSLESIQKGLPLAIAKDLSLGCRVSMHRGEYDEEFFKGLLR